MSGWTNTQAENITGLAFTYLASTVLYSTGSSLTLDAGAMFASATPIEVDNAPFLAKRTVSSPGNGMLDFRTAGIPVAPERIIDSRGDTDTIAPFAVFGDGQLEWGAGGSTARDVKLNRDSAGLLFVEGRLDSSDGVYGLPTVEVMTEVAPTPQTFTTTTYASYTGGSLGFFKFYDWTNLLINISLTCWSATANYSTFIGVQVNGVDYDVSRLFWNVGDESCHLTISGLLKITDALTSNNYTIQARVRSNLAGQTVHVDNDAISISCMEVS